MPQALPPGTMVSVERQSGSVPAFGGEQSSSDTSRCEARSSIDVDAVLPSLKGKGIALACTSSAGTPPYSMLYVESLGVALHLPVSADRIEDAKGASATFSWKGERPALMRPHRIQRIDRPAHARTRSGCNPMW